MVSFRKLRGALSGFVLAASTLGAVSMVATPSQAAEVNIYVQSHRPALRHELPPPPPHARYVRWEPGHWDWTGRRWNWASGHYEVNRHAPAHYEHQGWRYVR